MGTDQDWEKWGKKDPYFGVSTSEKFRRENLTAEHREEFFETGRNEVKQLVALLRDRFDPEFSPRRVLDFGCGVGRVLIPLSRLAEQVVGVDVSPSMLEEARKNCAAQGVDNVRLLGTDDRLSSLDGRFDLIHSSIVFQHIPIARGRRIFARMLDHLEQGGIGAIQFNYAKTVFADRYGTPPQQPPRGRLRGRYLELRHWIRDTLDGGAEARDPEMQMNPYNVSELLFILHTAGIHSTYTESGDHGGELVVRLLFRKPLNRSER